MKNNRHMVKNKFHSPPFISSIVVQFNNVEQQRRTIKQLIEKKHVSHRSELRYTRSPQLRPSYLLSTRVNYTLPINVAATFCASKLHWHRIIVSVEVSRTCRGAGNLTLLDSEPLSACDIAVGELTRLESFHSMKTSAIKWTPSMKQAGIRSERLPCDFINYRIIE